MNVFVTGATGALGRVTVPRLLADGHRVRALARSEANHAALGAAGAEPVAADLFDAASIVEATAGADAILHLATRIPAGTRVRFRRAWAESDRIRRMGTKHLVDAALANGVQRLVYNGFYAMYADSGDRWIDAEGGAVDPPWFLETNMEAEAHVARLAQSGACGVSLRMGWFLGPESPQTVELLSYAQRGFAAVPGAAEAYLPSIWVEDAGAAVVAALHAPSGVYDVVDDEPLTRTAYTEALAAAAGRRSLRRPPMFLIRLLAGSAGEAMGRSLRISNRRFKEATGLGAGRARRPRGVPPPCRDAALVRTPASSLNSPALVRPSALLNAPGRLSV